MTIKKTKKLDAASESDSTPTVLSNGAAIADRFKLDAPPPPAPKASSGKIVMFTLIAGVVALILVGFLAFTLWKHWEFLQGA